jgi:hypothetical protein
MPFISTSTMKMPALRTISNFSDSQVPISQPMMAAPSTANATRSLPTLAMAFDSDRLAVAHAAAVVLAAVTAAAPAVCHAMISAGIRR